MGLKIQDRHRQRDSDLPGFASPDGSVAMPLQHAEDVPASIAPQKQIKIINLHFDVLRYT